MALTFRYRYVDIGTVFAGDSRARDAQQCTENPSTLFANEIACDVGGTGWGASEPLAVIDCHSGQEAQFPSASAAVLHKAKLIRERFANPPEVLWLVTHKQSDFNAFCSMYLARWIVETSAEMISWERYGLHPDGWLDLPDVQRIDWLNPDLTSVPVEHRWPLLLASYASMLERRRHMSCPRERQLRSVLYAALKRGRDYLNPTSGANEFFDEVKSALLNKQLNPAYDSVLEGSTEFAAELAMLDREAAAYSRDIQRARKSIAYLPEAEAPSPDFFEYSRKLAQQPGPADVRADHLRLADTFRIPTDGIYLRDPECALFQEWARVDLGNSALGAGFEFTAIAYSDGRPNASSNRSEYIFALDSEHANGRHLYTVWSRLQTKEVEALRAYQEGVSAVRAPGATGSTEHRSDAVGSLLSDPWLGGQIQSSTLVDTPKRGTLIGAPGVRSDLRDDVVAEAVRTELEAPLYSATSLIAGPQVTVLDFAALQAHADAPKRRFDLNAPLEIPAPEEGCFRFAKIGLRSDVPIADGGMLGRRLVEQIGDILWQVLYPEQPGVLPQPFEPHLVTTANSLGVWSDRGLAIAQKVDANSVAEGEDTRDFAATVSLARDIDALAVKWKFVNAESGASDTAASSARTHRTSSLREIVEEGDELVSRAAQLQHTVSMPDRELLRRFHRVIGLDDLVARLRELHHAAKERLGRETAAEEARRVDRRAEDISHLRTRLEWLKVLLVGFISLGLIRLLTSHVDSGSAQTLALLGGPVVLGMSALLLQPWRRKRATAPDAFKKPGWFLVAAIVFWIALWLAEVLRVWNS